MSQCSVCIYRGGHIFNLILMFKPNYIIKCSECKSPLGVKNMEHEKEQSTKKYYREMLNLLTQDILCMNCTKLPIKKLHQCKWRECPKIDMDGALDDVILCMTHNLIFAQMAHGSMDNLKVATSNIIMDYIEVPDDYNE